jgi:hypothetical protein
MLLLFGLVFSFGTRCPVPVHRALCMVVTDDQASPPLDTEPQLPQKRVEMTIAYPMHPSWKQWAVAAATTIDILKREHPDVFVHRVIMAVKEDAPQDMQLRVGTQAPDDDDVMRVVDLSIGRGGIYLPMRRIAGIIQEERLRLRPDTASSDSGRGRGETGREGGRNRGTGRARVFTDVAARVERS